MKKIPKIVSNSVQIAKETKFLKARQCITPNNKVIYMEINLLLIKLKINHSNSDN